MELSFVQLLKDIWNAVVRHGHFEWTTMLYGGGISIFITILLIILLVRVFYKHDKILEWFSRNLTCMFFIAWSSGFVVYDIGMYPGDAADRGGAFLSLLGVAPMAIIHAFEMFILQSDISAIHDHSHNNSWYMFAFSLTHLFAAFVSLVFVIKHFGYSLMAIFNRLWVTFLYTKNKETLYVFWGINDATYYLAKDILKHIPSQQEEQNQKQKNKETREALKKSNARIIIIKSHNNKESEHELNSLYRLFNIISLNSNNFNHLKELQKKGCLTTNSYTILSNVALDENNKIIEEKLHLRSLKKLLNSTTKEVSIFFLSEDEVANITSVGILKQDELLTNMAKSGKKIKFYCHARYNSIHRVIEDETPQKNIDINVIDSSHLSVELMKKNIMLQPVNYVNIENDATVSSLFHSLVIGYGEVGLDAVRFLYEFGAFVKTGSTDDNVQRSAFRCDVVDKNMKELSGVLAANAPAINISIGENNNYKSLIKLHDMDCNGAEFALNMKVWIKTLNYIVIATENDETNISLAIRILRMAIRYRKDLDNFCIMVRVKEDYNYHLQRITDHYNRLYKAMLEARKNGNDRYQAVILNSDEIKEPIKLFGNEKDIYQYNHIISSEILKEAKEFYRNYEGKTKEEFYISEEESNNLIYKDLWEKRHLIMMRIIEEDSKGKTQQTGIYSPTYSGLTALRRMESQDFANSMHKDTKKRLFNKAMQLLNDANNGEISEASQNRILNVLAQTEHLRWNASHEILGYEQKGNLEFKDEARQLHGCLRPWQELSSEKQSYDHRVVSTSLKCYHELGNKVIKDEMTKQNES